nr:hypothetical protein [Oceanococcus sp. HetDA_MAG_MS8]
MQQFALFQWLSACGLLAAATVALAQDSLPRTGFEQTQGARWTTHEEELSFLAEVDALTERIDIQTIGWSHEGRPLQLVRLGHPRPVSLSAAQSMPVELHICTQHGNEPAGREACLIALRDLALSTDPVLIDQMARQLTLFIPTANPDGRETNSRTNAEGVDLNRQHLQVDQPEVRAMGRVIRDYKPVINMDHHEYGPTTPVLYDDDVLILWPRNLNVYPPLRDAAFAFSVDHITPCTEAAGYSVDEYGLQAAGDLDLQQTAGDWDDGISRNVGGLRHSFGILVESAVSMNPANPEELLDGITTGNTLGGAPASMRRRVESQVKLVDCALEYMREFADQGLQLTRESRQAKTEEGALQSAPTFFDGQDEDTTVAGAITGANSPQTLQDPPFCGFEIEAELVSEDLEIAMDIHGIQAEERPDGSLFVSMAQAAEPVIGLLLDGRSERHLVAAQGLSDCATSRAATPVSSGGGAMPFWLGVAAGLLGLVRRRQPSALARGLVRLAAASTLLLPGMAAADVCTPPVPMELCGGRIFAEPLNSIGGLTHREMVLGMQALATEYPDWVTFEEFGQGSADGLPLYAVEVTAPDSPIPYAERKIVLVNQSVHGNEPGGREGAARYTEDLVTGLDPERTALLDRVRLVQTFINPDGWTAGDHDHVQTGGGAYFWARQNGAGPVSGVGDLGLGVDLNRQAPWRGISHPSGPVSQPESTAFVDYVRKLASEGDIQVAVDIHGEVTDAAAWVMLSSGKFNLDDALNQRYHGEAVRSAIIESLADSSVSDLINTISGGVEPMVLTASSEFGNIASESTASGTGFLGDWISQPEGGGAASMSTIELYNFLVSPGVNSLTARPEVMQYYRDTVRGILAGMIEQAAVEHDTRMVGGSLLWVDDFPRIADPVREGVEVSAADFFSDLAPWYAGDLRATSGAGLAAALAAFPESVTVHTAGLAANPEALAALRSYVQGGGNLVLTDAALNLLPELVAEISPEQITLRLDNGGKVSYDRSHKLAAGIRDISWMNTETATMGLRVENDANVPTWRVDTAAWEAVGGTTAGVSGGQTSVGELAVGAGRINIIGVLLPNPDSSDPNIGFGLNGYGVLDTGYIVFANALNATLEHVTTPAVAGADLSDTPESRIVFDAARGGALHWTLLLLVLLGAVRRRGRGACE